MDVRWTMLELFDEEELRQTAAWMQEERNLHQSCLQFFTIAGKLIAFSVDDYEIASVAFFHAVIGLERSLRMHYSTRSFQAVEDAPLARLLERAVAEEAITDSRLLGQDTAPRLHFFRDRGCDFERAFQHSTYSAKLAALIPWIRNAYMHGEYVMFPESIQLAIHLRRFADALNTQPMRNQ